MLFELSSKFPFVSRISGEQRTAKLQGIKRLWDEWLMGGGTTSAGVTVNGETALKHSAYWRAVNLLSSQIASFPIGLFKRLPNGNTEEIFKHPAVRLLTRQANNIMTPFIWKESTQANALTRGNGYSYIKRDGGGSPLSLTILDSDNMDPRAEDNQLIYDYGGDIIDPYYILHIPGLSFDGVKGKSV